MKVDLMKMPETVETLSAILSAGDLAEVKLEKNNVVVVKINRKVKSMAEAVD